MYTHPYTRLHRTKKHQWARDLFAENHIAANQLILPIFITDGVNIKTEIQSMPGIYVLSADLALDLVKAAKDLGISAIALFPKIAQEIKDVSGSHAFDKNNIVCKLIKNIKSKVPGIGILADVALDPYTSHGHDGILDQDGFVDNDSTVAMLCKQSLILAESGCDVLAPSDMMDGRVIAIRKLLEDSKYCGIQIYSYAAKYASTFYSPFRDAVGSIKSNGIDKRHYQLNPANIHEAMKKVKLDISEGADAIIVKPAMLYLDVIKEIKSNILTKEINVIAYQVSGEYSMLKFAAQHGALDYLKAQIESMISIKRSGASAVMTYGALDIANFL
jgi:porphobilinogen synthase